MKIEYYNRESLCKGIENAKSATVYQNNYHPLGTIYFVAYDNEMNIYELVSARDYTVAKFIVKPKTNK